MANFAERERGFVCVCVCMCVKERYIKRDRDTHINREGGERSFFLNFTDRLRCHAPNFNAMMIWQILRREKEREREKKSERDREKERKREREGKRVKGRKRMR